MKLTMLVALMAAVLPGAGVPWLPSMTYGLWKTEALGAINCGGRLRGAANVRPMPEFRSLVERKNDGVSSLQSPSVSTGGLTRLQSSTRRPHIAAAFGRRSRGDRTLADGRWGDSEAEDRN